MTSLSKATYSNNVKYEQLYFGATSRKIKGFEGWDRSVFLQKWLILADFFFFSLDVLGNKVPVRRVQVP